MKLLAAFTVVVLLFCSTVATATEPQQPDTEPDDSEAVEESEKDEKDKTGGYRVLPIPVFITEPAIGEGLGLAVALFHPVKSGAVTKPRALTPKSIGDAQSEREAPPVVTGVFGGYTSSGTWAGGVGHFNNWRRDTIRYTGVLAVADVFSDFYLGNLPVGYELDGNIVYQDLRFRVAGSNIFLGGALSYLDSTVTFDDPTNDLIPPEFLTRDITQVGLAGRFIYEGRDIMSMPTKGQLLELSLWRFDEALGSDFDYWSLTPKLLSFHRLTKRFLLDLRLEVGAVSGDPPFFGYPWVKLRGVPAMRYQDEVAGAVEVQGRVEVSDRWLLLAFTGRGFISGDLVSADEDADIYNYGAGTRFNIFKDRDIWIGIDIAKGPDDWAWYVEINHPW